MNSGQAVVFLTAAGVVLVRAALVVAFLVALPGSVAAVLRAGGFFGGAFSAGALPAFVPLAGVLPDGAFLAAGVAVSLAAAAFRARGVVLVAMGWLRPGVQGLGGAPVLVLVDDDEECADEAEDGGDAARP